MSRFFNYLRIAARGLVRQPTVSLTIIITLALAIGANTAIFSFIDSVLLTPPPFEEPDRVAVIWGTNAEVKAAMGLQYLPLSTAVYYDMERESGAFNEMGLVQSAHMTLTGRGEPEQLGVVRISGDFFGALGTEALVGRALTPEDDPPGTPTALVISHSYWQRRFNGDRNIVGETLTLNGMPMTLVGVMPPGFGFPRGGSEVEAAYGFESQPDAWVPLALTNEERYSRTNRFSLAVGRLAPGADFESAEQELVALTDRLAEEHPETDTGWGAEVVPITEQVSGGLRPALLMLWAAGGLVLLIATVNVANLLLARAMSRYKEIAVRTAIGASRRRLLTQLLTESLLLSLAGSVVGIVLAVLGLRLFGAFFPPGIAGAADFQLDGRALAFTLLLAVITTLLGGLLPAFQMLKTSFAGALRDGTRAGVTSPAVRRVRSALVVGEVALAVLLLIGSGLLMRSFMRLVSLDPGFNTDTTYSFRLDLPPEGYPPPERVEFFTRVVDELKSNAGVEGAGIISELPLSGSEQFMSVVFEGRGLPQGDEYWSVGLHSIIPGYFDAIGLPIVAGRALTPGDNVDAAKTAVIDQAMAKAYWPDEDPLGKRFRLGRAQKEMDDPSWITVVGISGDIRHSGLDQPPTPNAYLPMAQAPEVLTPYYVWAVVDSELPDGTLATLARSAVDAVDPAQPVTQQRSMETVIQDSLKERRFSLMLLGAFAALAMVLAVVGIYGIISYSVLQRRREWGLRVALGAKPVELHTLVLKEALLLAGLGVVIGIGAALGLTRFIASQLHDLPTTDPLTFLAVALGLTLVALIAAYLPARRASRVDPIVTLQAE